MKNSKHDFSGAIRQIFVILCVTIWLGWLYMLITGQRSGMKHVGRYGQSWYDEIDANGMLFMAILITVFVVFAFFLKKSK